MLPTPPAGVVSVDVPLQPGEMLARLNSMHESLHKELQDSGNTLAAYIGELENRLEDSQVLRPDGTQTTRTG